MTMTHPGLPWQWGLVLLLLICLLGVWAVIAPMSQPGNGYRWKLLALPVAGPLLRFFTVRPWPLWILRIGMVSLFLLVIVAGLFGTPIPERNFATMLTWNLWWTGLIISVFFLGSAWCAVCPWDALAGWLVHWRGWRRTQPAGSLNLRVPAGLRNVLPALLLFIGLTWLELGFGITTSPYLTAQLALLMIILATLSLAIFERKAFCHYFCPVGRTVGFYSQLAPVELRPVDPDLCARCTTLECYHGTNTVEPCPTHLVMGNLRQNTYCTSCANCSQACPDQNIAWQLRPPSQEAIQDARPHWDEAWFMICLLALTLFHGVSMLPFFENWVSMLARVVGAPGQLLSSFSLLLLLSLLIPVLIYLIFIWLTRWLIGSVLAYKRFFTGFAFVALPLAFAYHLAHNLNHLVRESVGFGTLLSNPLGMATQPLSMLEKHHRYLQILIPEDVLFGMQAGLLLFGFWISLKVIRHRGHSIVPAAGWRLFPMIVFAAGFTGFQLWLLMQPMMMRM
ncbi:MAG: hypothetical protein A2W28_08265 [Gammaproteobacteria bacterium RBG_16_51_14]|nr:MAG: hypothetical protein A2W28_08265 [Gammaproteobacteria bacterium RBG_16_51_14]